MATKRTAATIEESEVEQTTTDATHTCARGHPCSGDGVQGHGCSTDTHTNQHTHPDLPDPFTVGEPLF